MMNSDSIDVSTDATEPIMRFLQTNMDSNKGRIVLTVLYLCVLSFCVIVPVYFYCRMQCEERSNSQVRELEVATISQAMAESQNVHREESRAQRQKYREERRARIIQLFMPVRMILKEDHFVESKPSLQQLNDSAHNNIDIESPDIQRIGSRSNDDEADNFILVPEPGLPKGALLEIAGGNIRDSKPPETKIMRQVPNECSICLCEYTVGNDIVWSSNPQCDHVFHEECIEQWLMKQREGPLCPCCRRDFVIDPFDDVEAADGIFLTLDNLATDVVSGIPAIDRTMETIESQDYVSDHSGNRGEQEA